MAAFPTTHHLSHLADPLSDADEILMGRHLVEVHGAGAGAVASWDSEAMVLAHNSRHYWLDLDLGRGVENCVTTVVRLASERDPRSCSSCGDEFSETSDGGFPAQLVTAEFGIEGNGKTRVRLCTNCGRDLARKLLGVL
jgi:hypothetical protein